MKARVKNEAVGPFFGVVTTWFAIEYLRPQDYANWIGVLRPGLMVLVILFLIWLARADKSILKDNLILLYGTFLALGIISVFFARNTYWAAQTNLNMLSFLLGGVLPLIAFIDRPEALRRFFGAWVIFNGIVGVVAIIRGGTGSGSFLQDENDLALTMAVALPFTYFLALYGSHRLWVKGFFMVLGFIMVGAIIASSSRGGFLGLLAASLGIVWFSKKKIRNFISVSLIAVVVASVVSQTYVEEMRSIEDAKNSTRLSRLYYWGRGWEMFADNPVLGVGTANFGYIIEDYENKDPTFPGDKARSGGRVSHSLFFTLLPEYGLVGTIVYAALAIGVWNRLHRVRKRLVGHQGVDVDVIIGLSRAASASLLAFFVAGAFLSVLYYPHFWYLLGFTLGLDRLALKIAPDPARRPLFASRRANPSPSEAA